MTNKHKQMKDGLEQLKVTIEEPTEKKQFERTINDFMDLYERYERQKEEDRTVEWDKIEDLDENQLITLENIIKKQKEEEKDEEKMKMLLNGLVVLKLNGGLGTTMGCTGPKSVIEVRNKKTFLDLSIEQLLYLNNKYNVDIPLVLMNSFNTHEDTKKIIQKYKGKGVTILTFNQKKFPRIIKESMSPLPTTTNIFESKNQWYPPGHGDIYHSLYHSPVYEQLKEANKKYIFLSNVDNLGAVLNVDILAHLTNTNTDFAVEVTKKTKADVKGGTLIKYDNKIKLLELAQVPEEHVESFKDITKFKIFNTNNLWISMKGLKRLIEDNLLDDVDIIVNRKTYKETPVLQLETAAGAAVQVFNKSLGIVVPRSRFLPVKKTSDLFIVQSDLYEINEAGLLIKQTTTPNPSITFHDTYYAKVNDYLTRFPKGIPSIRQLESLTINKDVTFDDPSLQLVGHVVYE